MQYFRGLIPERILRILCRSWRTLMSSLLARILNGAPIQNREREWYSKRVYECHIVFRILRIENGNVRIKTALIHNRAAMFGPLPTHTNNRACRIGITISQTRNNRDSDSHFSFWSCCLRTAGHLLCPILPHVPAHHGRYSHEHPHLRAFRVAY